MFDFSDIDFDADSGPAPLDSGPSIPDAAECLRCGVCLGSCPTYRLFKVEAETPRARLQTLVKLLNENRPVSDAETRHLNNCLQCRACENVCPSRMAYGLLFDRALAESHSGPGRLAKLGFWLIENKAWRLRLMPLVALYRGSGLNRLLRKSGLLKALGLAEAEALMGKPSLRRLAAHYSPGLGKRGSVGLFTGCLAETFDRETQMAAIALLNAIGFDVIVPFEQTCCGAIHRHNGQSAAGLIQRNIAVFNALKVDAVIHTATGCGAMLGEYGEGDDPAAERFRERLSDIHDFLLAHWPKNLHLLPRHGKAAVHEPCSQRNVLKNARSVYALLEKIPGLNVEPLPDNATCCGAGGSYMLTHPANAEQLRHLKQQAIDAASADLVVSANFGCSVFLNAGPAKTIAAVHPLLLLAAQLPQTDSDETGRS